VIERTEEQKGVYLKEPRERGEAGGIRHDHHETRSRRRDRWKETFTLMEWSILCSTLVTDYYA
jgi:hypothetical protein